MVIIKPAPAKLRFNRAALNCKYKQPHSGSARQILLCACCCFLFPPLGCRRQSQQPTIALITPLTTTEMWKAMHAGVYRAVSQAHYRRYWNAPTHERDYERQIELVQQELARGVLGIVLAPVHASALGPVVAEAERAKVPIVVVANQLATPMTPAIASITSDDAEAGTLGADAIATLTGGKGSVVIVGLDPLNSATLLRADSFKTRLELEYPKLKIVATAFVRDSSPRFLAPNPDLDHIADARAIFSLNASSTREVVAQLQQIDEKARPVVVGCDQDADLYDDLRGHRIDALIAQDTFRMGYLATQEIVEALRTGRAPESKSLAPMLITRENLDSAQAKQILKPYAGFDR